MPLNHMSFRLKPSYFERDGPVCTRSASSFCRNPLNFCTHVAWVKWLYHDKFQPFLSSGCSPFQFQGHLAENKSLNARKIPNEVRKGWNYVNLACWMQKKFEGQFVHEWMKNNNKKIAISSKPCAGWPRFRLNLMFIFKLNQGHPAEDFNRQTLLNLLCFDKSTQSRAYKPLRPVLD